MLIGHDRMGVWQDHSHNDAFFPRTKETESDAGCREQQHLIQPKELSAQHGVGTLRSTAWSGYPPKRWLSQEPEENLQTKSCQKTELLRVPPLGLLGSADC